MIERYSTVDGSISKYIHEDGSETSIKTWPPAYKSCGGSGRSKFNIFASISSGCPVGCKFCFLTSKNFPYKRLSRKQVSSNVISAVREELKCRPELRELPMNLSWMGMGDAFIDPDLVYGSTEDIFGATVNEVVSFEGVDIATSLPILHTRGERMVSSLDRLLSRYSHKLTVKPLDRSNIRIFFSLHSLLHSSRDKLIPSILKPAECIDYLESLVGNKFNLIYHHMFLDSFNDSKDEIDEVIKFFSSRLHRQLRILRFNKCKDSIFIESKNFNDIVKELYLRLGDNLKVQLSPGSEVSAACGMFLMPNNKSEDYNHVTA